MTDFDYKWKEGTVRGWEKRDEDAAENSFYCRACQLNFKNENTFIHHHDGKKHKKNESSLKKQLEQGTISQKQYDAKPTKENPNFTGSMRRDLALKENTIMNMKNLLCDIIQDTMNQVRKKQTRTIEEYTAERDNNENQTNIDSSDSEEEETGYNPKNYPLGYDGK